MGSKLQAKQGAAKAAKKERAKWDDPTLLRQEMALGFSTDIANILRESFYRQLALACIVPQSVAAADAEISVQVAGVASLSIAFLSAIFSFGLSKGQLDTLKEGQAELKEGQKELKEELKLKASKEKLGGLQKALKEDVGGLRSDLSFVQSVLIVSVGIAGGSVITYVAMAVART
mmetsp:Transcript_51557/g.95388  ORF Transcript_51557/g.95388 Transcript_51557/m.95388 type:complete len:175 (+) Transcript_51557:182-706(+)